MDGNRRFAKTHNLSIERGHRLGGSALEKVLGACYLAGVKILTVYAFSTENFQRPRAQVDAIMHLLREQIARCSAPGGLAEQLGVAIRVLGRLDLLDDETRGAVMKAVDTTRGGNRLILNLCVAYSSRDEMTRAVRRSVEEYSHPRSPSHPETALTAQSLSDKMYTADNPPVDILVRSSGVYRLSDFLLWQCHQATHIQFLDTLWPDFGAWELFMVLLRWQRMRATTGRSRAGDAQAMVSCYISPGVCVLLALFSFFSAVSYYLAIV
ncbi:undecaprenyl diphosphate synthase family protein [Aspergillus thermomutatus]|uniref:Alkyl transferase n=1 Tax=Aspergillus thermomutatus TaxID=41047 RepID=A0A397G064_ASPTH|nr:uncharacterized protein CDV56_100717 [Aspergillus thermomutatus]RHZ43214.1 hypothetical protein CDV56_100717 [Aspergillus thermomutatus]